MDLAEIWSQVPADYFSTGVKTNFLQRIWHGRKLKPVAESVGRDKINVLVEVGSADGSFVNSLSKKISCNQIIAVDPYLPPLKHGSKNFTQIRFIQADAHKLPLKTESADAITILETLEHVSDPNATLTELRRILKKDGRIIVEMDSGSLLFQIVWFLWKKYGKGKVWNRAHLTFFTVKILEQLFRKSRLEIQEKRLFNWGMGVCFRLTRSTAPGSTPLPILSLSKDKHHPSGWGKKHRSVSTLSKPRPLGRRVDGLTKQ